MKYRNRGTFDGCFNLPVWLVFLQKSQPILRWYCESIFSNPWLIHQNAHQLSCFFVKAPNLMSANCTTATVLHNVRS